jgi:hypothetical protein
LVSGLVDYISAMVRRVELNWWSSSGKTKAHGFQQEFIGGHVAPQLVNEH